jgi:hypothetical protein
MSFAQEGDSAGWSGPGATRRTWRDIRIGRLLLAMVMPDQQADQRFGIHSVRLHSPLFAVDLDACRVDHPVLDAARLQCQVDPESIPALMALG